MNKIEKIEFIIKNWREKNFYSDTGKEFWAKRNSNLSDEFIDALFFEAYHQIVQRDMPFVMCDILGFTTKMREKKNLEIYHNLIRSSFASLSEINLKSLLPDDFFDEDHKSYSEIIKVASKPFKINSMQFSDTIIFYPQIIGTIFQLDIDSDTNRLFDQILLTLTLSMAAKYFADMIRQGYLIRGAITYGDLLIQNNPPLYIGSAVERVHELETLQEWAGIALTPESILKIQEVGLLDDSLIIQYNPPIKDESKFEKMFSEGILPYVVDWRNLVNLDKELIENEAKNNQGIILPGVKVKICNTLKFYNLRVS